MSDRFDVGGVIPGPEGLRREARAAANRALAGARGAGGRIPGPSRSNTATRGTGQACGESFIPAGAECHKAKGPNQLGAWLRRRFPEAGVDVQEASGRLMVSTRPSKRGKGQEVAAAAIKQAELYAKDRGLRLVVLGPRADAIEARLARLARIEARKAAARLGR